MQDAIGMSFERSTIHYDSPINEDLVPLASTSRLEDEDDMIIEEESGSEHEPDDFVVEDDEDHRPAKRPRTGHTRVGLRRAAALEAAPDVRWTSTKKRRYGCARCEEDYTRNHHLGRHLVRMHLDEEDQIELDDHAACSECSVTFSRYEDLSKHFKKSHRGRPEMNWDDIKRFYDDLRERLTYRNEREWVAKRGPTAPNGIERGLEVKELIGTIVWAHKKTRWSSHWPRGKQAARAADGEEDPEREWDEEQPRPSGKLFEASSVARPVETPFLSAPPVEHSDDEFVFEDEEQPPPDPSIFSQVTEDKDPSVPLVSKPPIAYANNPNIARRAPRGPSAPPPKRTSPAQEKAPKPVPVPHVPRPVSVAPQRNGTPKPVNSVSLTLADSRSGQGMRLSTSRRVPFNALVKVFVESANIDEARLTFFFRGKVVDQAKTPEQLQMKEGDFVWYDANSEIMANGDVAVPAPTPGPM